METLTNKQIREIAAQYGTPCYIAFPDRFKKNLNDFRIAFTSEYDKFILGYSFKTNYTPFLLKIVKELGGYAEVVSDMEYELALKMGFESKHIILNGPIKRPELLKKAILNNSIVQLDSDYEVDSVISLSRKVDCEVRVGLRVNMEINTNNSQSAVQAGLKESRFGFSTAGLNSAIKKLKECRIKIISLHGHTSTTNRLTDNYVIISSRLLEICSSFALDDVQYLDIGGGFFGAPPIEIDITDKPTYKDYARAVCNTMKKNEWFNNHTPAIVIEPGTSVVANVFELLTQVYQHKNIRGHHFVFVDATVAQVRSSRSTVNYPFEIISDKLPQQAIIADIVGSTCMEVDVLSNKVNLEHYSLGDLLLYKAAGAYRINMFPDFILYRAPVVLFEGNSTYLHQKRMDIEAFVNANMQICNC
jgi:diaminopimelate decarboxylase